MSDPTNPRSPADPNAGPNAEPAGRSSAELGGGSSVERVGGLGAEQGGGVWDRLLLGAPTVGALLLALTGVGRVSSVHLGVVVVSAVVLMLRRRWPVVVLVVALGGFVGFLDLVPLAVAVYAVAVQPSARRWQRALPVLVLLVIPVGYLLRAAGDDEQELLANVPIVMLLCAVLPAVIALLIRARREQAAAIAELIRSREREAMLIAQTVRAEERVLLAREMHDVVADKISLISVRAGALAVTRGGDDVVQAEAETIRGLSKATLRELREVLAVLREPGAGSAEGLSALPELLAGSGLDAGLTIAAGVQEELWSAAAQRAVYRTVQEALTNVRKYAASARTEVVLAQREDHLAVTVRNGPARRVERDPALPSGGHGLTGLRERAELLGAEFSAGATEAGGFLVEVRIPAGAGNRPR
ncbi:histidine kinase [Kribbella sp. NPDC051718]|uniref:sensor histidine kinase n=1 Tax=Kribbella sp. NPDC051718 TaxID=3155168 RepID=UPI0034250CB0